MKVCGVFSALVLTLVLAGCGEEAATVETNDEASNTTITNSVDQNGGLQ